MSNQFFQENGYFVLPEIVSNTDCQEIINALPDVENAGSRKLLDFPIFSQLAETIKHHSDLVSLLDLKKVVQCIYFKKTQEKNWSVRLHQDKVLPINGSGAWDACGVKEGLNFVRPPDSFLQQVIAVRLSLDDINEADLDVVAGSHLVEQKPKRQEASKVIVPVGGALIMLPLLFHSSSKLILAPARRVLHFVFAPEDLPYSYKCY